MAVEWNLDDPKTPQTKQPRPTTLEQIKAMIDNSPQGTTHTCIENGTFYQFQIKGFNAKVNIDGEWVSYAGCALPDLENVSLLSDLKRISALEQQINS